MWRTDRWTDSQIMKKSLYVPPCLNSANIQLYMFYCLSVLWNISQALFISLDISVNKFYTLATDQTRWLWNTVLQTGSRSQGSRSHGGHLWCHMRVLDERNKPAKYKHCTLSRPKATDKMVVKTDKQTDWQTNWQTYLKQYGPYCLV